MLTNNEIKHICSLQQKKFRNLYKQFIAEGPKLVDELIESKFIFNRIYAKKEWLENNLLNLQKKNIPFTEINNIELERLSSLTTPNSVIAVLNIPEQIIPDEFYEEELIFVLDDIKDPGNLGTIIRTADWFGVNNIICSENTVELYSPKVVQATMGAVARVNVYHTDLTAFLKTHCKKANIIGAYTNGKDISQFKSDKQQLIIVIGNESKGISGNLEPYIKQKISIPAYRKHYEKCSESLNAAVSAAILCYALKVKGH